MIPKTEKDSLWKDLKIQWSYLKRDSGSDEIKKGHAKERINEIQEALSLEKTDWNTPRSGAPGSHLTTAGASVSPSNNALVEKILGTVLDMKRIIGEEFIQVNQKLTRLEENCTCHKGDNS